MWFVPRLYNEEQLRLREYLETAVRRVWGWCEMAASLGVREMEWSSEFGSWKPVSSPWKLQWNRRQTARTWSNEHVSWRIYGVGSHYQTTTGEDTVDAEDLVRIAVNCRLCVWISDGAIVTCSHELFRSSINPITNSNLVYSQSYTLQYLQIHPSIKARNIQIIFWDRKGLLCNGDSRWVK
jgi:hypothetical protein